MDQRDQGPRVVVAVALRSGMEVGNDAGRHDASLLCGESVAAEGLACRHAVHEGGGV